MKSFLYSLYGEFFKIWKNTVFLIILAFPLVVTLILTLTFIFDDDLTVSNFWTYYGADVSMFYAIGYPLIMSLVAFTTVNIEIKNSTNKQLFYLPIEPYKLYLSKCVVLISYFTLSVLIAYGLFILSSFFLSLVVPSISNSLQNFDSSYLIFLFFIKIYILTLPIIFFLFYISLLIPKLWCPTTIAFILYICGLMAFKTSFVDFFPNAALTKLAWIELQSESIVLFDRASIMAFLYSVLFIFLGYFSFKNLKTKIDS